MVGTANRLVDEPRDLGPWQKKEALTLPLPAKVEEVLRQFILDRKTGNVRINVKDGRVLGVHLEEIVVIR